MARPSVTHDGFLIPNASDVSDPRMAEPDRIDFNTLAHARWGVIEGCLVVMSSTTATTEGGTAVVDGVLVTMPPGTAPVPVGGELDRFDLIAVDANGTLRVVVGSPAEDPVFPDPPDHMTALAMVYARSGISNFVDDIVDKRKFLPKALLTKLPAGSPLIQNRNGAGDMFSVAGSGLMTWGADTVLSRSDPETLRVQNHLRVLGDEDVLGDLDVVGDVTVEGKVNSANLITATVLPDTAGVGTLFQHEVSGRVYVRRIGGWEELATLNSANPVATIITSLQPPAVMIPNGWIPLDGSIISEANVPSLFTIPALVPYISGTVPNRVMAMPNATGRMLVTDWTGGAGKTGGAVGNTIHLNEAQMPQHVHRTRVLAAGGYSPQARAGRAGIHSHTTGGGEHGHNTTQVPHRHNGMEGPSGTNSDVVGLFWGGRNKIDALFNDRNHTFSVENLQWTMPATIEITIGSQGSGHGHILTQDGDHDHPIVIDPIPTHFHPVAEDPIGEGAGIDITPAFLTVYTYVRS